VIACALEHQLQWVVHSPGQVWQACQSLYHPLFNDHWWRKQIMWLTFSISKTYPSCFSSKITFDGYLTGECFCRVDIPARQRSQWCWQSPVKYGHKGIFQHTKLSMHGSYRFSKLLCYWSAKFSRLNSRQRSIDSKIFLEDNWDWRNWWCYVGRTCRVDWSSIGARPKASSNQLLAVRFNWPRMSFLTW